MRRYICEACGVKWFLLDDSRHEPPSRCARCDGPLRRFATDGVRAPDDEEPTEML